jgi:hypothetical protein
MRSNLTTKTMWTLIAMASVVVPGLAGAAEAPKELAAWLGRENTVDATSLNDHLPKGAKLTLVYDEDDDVVRICTRAVASQVLPWREDMAKPCQVTLNFVRAQRYCSYEEVKTGNAEALAGCHRLRSNSVALHPAKDAGGALELHDVVLYLLEASATSKRGFAFVIDSPSTVTHGLTGHTSS